MKKKIKDLTITECQKICNTIKCGGNCFLWQLTHTCFARDIKKEMLEREVEIDESNND